MKVIALIIIFSIIGLLFALPIFISGRIKRMRRLKKFLIGAAIFFVVFTLVGFFILPPIAKSILVKKLSETLHREVTIEILKVNPYKLTLTLRDFVIKDRKGSETFASCQGLYLNLQSVSALKGGLILREVKIEGPHINIIRNEDMSYNFSDLIGEKNPHSKPLRFSFNNIHIINGSVAIWDKPKNAKHTVKDINLTIPSLSNFPYHVDLYVQPAFAAKVNGTPIALQGKTKPFADSLETTFDVGIKDFNIPHYLAYIPLQMNFKVLSGYIDTKARISYVRFRDRKPTLNITGDIALKMIEVVDKKGDPVFKLPLVSIKETKVNLTKKELTVGEFFTKKGMLVVRRLSNGNLNLKNLFYSSRPPAEEVSQAKGGQPERPWLITLKKVLVEEYTVKAQDLIPTQPVTIIAEQIRLSAEKISTAKDSKGNIFLSFLLNKKGTVSASGSIGINPTFVMLNLNPKGIEIRPFQPYFTDKVKIIVTKGKISTPGNLVLNYSEKKGLKATFTGRASVNNFSSIDVVNMDDFLKWKSLYLNSINVGYNPTYVEIDKIALTDFYSRLIINSDGTLNLQAIVGDKGPKAETGQSQKTQDNVAHHQNNKEHIRHIKIRETTFKGGRIDFLDRYIKPNFSANLVDIAGRISGLSSEESKLADVKLTGKMDNYAPIEIIGKINPLREDLYVDLKIGFKEMDLSPLTSYSGKYLGYTIQKGKLALDLQYLIVKKRLDSQNKIFFDQLTLGDKVESADAITLPIKIAIALLKDRKGEIKLDIPVAGYIDDPEFSLGRIIIKIIMNLIKKAATSPFSLIGKIFGGGEELSYIEFNYGSSTITDQNKKKLNTLIKALYERPALKLEIEGYIDTEKDREGLRLYLFNKKLKAQKLKEMVKEGLPAVPVDEVEIEPHESERYLKKAYKAEKFPKPKNIIGIAKKLPAAEMEKLILTNIQVKDDDLRLLALQRVAKVKDYILSSGQVEPERLFLIEPRLLSPEKKEKLKDSRVNFRLK